MTITDTGPLVALIDRRQSAHQRCREILQNAALPLITTWPCFTEAMYFAQREGGHSFQQQLWRFVKEGVLRIYSPGGDVDGEFLGRMEELMQQYRDLPMDLADASILAAAEKLNLRRIFTLDKRHFYVYMTPEGSAYEVVPE